MDVTYEGTLRELQTDQGVLRYHEYGDGPPLVLLHGSGIGVSGWRNYKDNLAVFGKHFRCLALEFPGFGASDPVEGHPVLTAGAAVIRFLDGLGIDSAPVIGNSMGGVVGVNLAIKHPERISKLVTIGGVGPNVFTAGPSEGIRLLQEFADSPDRDKAVRWLRSMVYNPDIVTDEVVEARWQASQDPNLAASTAMMYGSKAWAMQQQFMATSDNPPYWSMMHKVQCPTLLTWGRDDRVSPVDMAMVPMRLIPQAELHVFPRCGHWVMIEAKEAFEGAALEFLLR